MQHDEALDQDETKQGDVSDKLAEVHKTAMRRFQDTVIPQQEQRAQSLQARRFVSIPGAMWDGPWGEQFENSIKVEVNKVLRGVRKIENDYRQNRIVPDFRPAGSVSNSETADLLDGLHRADSYFFKAQQARDNAFSEAVKGGFGAYRLTNEYADPYDKDSDEQRINPAMTIVDADQSVFFDGNSKLYDKSDSDFAFVITADTREAAEEEFGKQRIEDWDTSLRQRTYDWYTPDLVRKCEYYDVEQVSEKLWTFTHPLTEVQERWWDSEVDAEYRKEKRDTGWKIESQNRKRKRIRKYLMNGSEVIKDQGYIAGCNIPIVPVYGAREYIDGQERFKGHVVDKMDAQRLYNAKVSKLAETDALAPREKPIFAASQMPPHLALQWQRQEIDRHAYALIEPLFDPSSGQIVSAGPLGMVQAPQVSPVTAALMQIANTDLTEDDANQADEVKANTSAEAMDIAATRVDAKSGIYLDNMRQSVQREGEIYLDQCREVYFEPGRIVETMTEDGDDGEAELHQMVTDPKTGESKIINDLQRGKYKVIADVTEATATRRDKTVKRMIEMAEVAIQAQDMEGAQALFGTAVINSDGEGIGDLHKWWRARMVKLGVVEPSDEEKATMEAAAQQAGQPDPVSEAQVAALAAGAEKDSSAAKLNDAKTVTERANAMLKAAQADAVGGPASVPETPSGLDQAERLAAVDKTIADTAHIREKTRGLPEERRMKIAKGRDLQDAF